MQVTARELSHLLNGRVEGDPETLVTGPSKIEEGEPGTITFLANPKYERFVYTTRASLILVNEAFQPAQPITATLIRVSDVYSAVAALLEKFGNASSNGQSSGIHALAFVSPEATIGAHVSIGAYAVVEAGAVVGDHCVLDPQSYIGKNARVGDSCHLYPGVKVYHDCVIGARCIIHSNAVIGSDGFGFAPQADGSFVKIAQVGNVVIEDDVEVGSGTIIDRATMGSTKIAKGAKLDNLIQVAHNVEIGENTVIAAQAGIAGSSKIGANAMIGGQAGIAGHLKIANGTKIQAQAGINRNITQENTAVYGSPALDYNDFLRAYAIFRRLPDLEKRLRYLEEQLKNQPDS